MKYIFMNESKNGLVIEEFKTAEEACARADQVFNALFDTDKKNLEAFYVLESVNPDDEAPDHFDGNIVRDYL